MRRITQSSSLQRLVLTFTLLVAWEAASGRWVSKLFFSSPSAIAEKMLALLLTGTIVPHSAATFSQTAVGFVIGFVAGVVVANVLGLLPTFGRVAEPILTFFYSLPRIAIAPLFVIWFGIDFSFKSPSSPSSSSSSAPRPPSPGYAMRTACWWMGYA